MDDSPASVRRSGLSDIGAMNDLATSKRVLGARVCVDMNPGLKPGVILGMCSIFG